MSVPAVSIVGGLIFLIPLFPTRRWSLIRRRGDLQIPAHQENSERIRVVLDFAIGIGENAHIAFNDPPADFDTREAFKVVDLDDDCKKQQIGEGWFATLDDVPKQAISMTVYQIMQCKVIVSCVPYKVKAKAVKLTLESDLTNLIPSTMLQTHDNMFLFIDEESASLVDSSLLNLPD